MTWRGRVEWVQTTVPRGFLASDQTAGVSSLPVTNGAAFLPDVDAVEVVLDGVTYTATVVVSDDEAVTPSTLTISPVLAADQAEGEPVTVVTDAELKVAGVTADDGTDPVTVTVPHNLGSYMALVDGTYSGEDRPTVDVDRVNGELIILNVVGKVAVLDSDVTTYGQPGQLVNSYATPENVVSSQVRDFWINPTDASTWVVIGGLGDNVLQKYLSGEITPVVDVVLGSGSLTSIAGDSSGNVYVVADATIWKYSSAGSLLSTFTCPLHTQDIFVDAAGTIWLAVGAIGAVTIRKLNSSGTQLASYPVASMFSPVSIWVNVSGEMFFSGDPGIVDTIRVNRYDSSGTQVDTWDLTGSAEHIYGDDAGFVYVLSNGAVGGVDVGKVHQFALDGTPGIVFDVKDGVPTDTALGLQIVGTRAYTFMRNNNIVRAFSTTAEPSFKLDPDTGLPVATESITTGEIRCDVIYTQRIIGVSIPTPTEPADPANKAYVDAATGTWQTYTPAWTAATTDPVLNNGTIEGTYCDRGEWVDYMIQINIGTSTTFGSGSYSVTLPPIAEDDYRWMTATGSARDVSANITYPLYGERQVAGELLLRADPTTAGNQFRSANSGVPFAFNDDDVIMLTGSYRKA